MGIFQVMHLVKGTSDLRQLGLQVIDQTLDLGQQGCVAGLRLGQDAFLGVSLPWRGKVGFIMMTPLSPDCQELCCLKLYQWKGNIPLLPGQDLSYLNTEKQPQYPAQEQSFREQRNNGQLRMTIQGGKSMRHHTLVFYAWTIKIYLRFGNICM
uniref:Uncharacterized protein n=2 Tax=Rousettus aegyptiacus TaxID=9407 RepID=A0A7J8GB28_ROUAE|nr:hypothetical protein HJG63_011696 [Rousettus aegyptiacus]